MGNDNYSIPKAYRPIMLFNTISRVLEAILATRISYMAETYHLLLEVTWVRLVRSRPGLKLEPFANQPSSLGGYILRGRWILIPFAIGIFRIFGAL